MNHVSGVDRVGGVDRAGGASSWFAKGPQPMRVPNRRVGSVRMRVWFP